MSDMNKVRFLTSCGPYRVGTEHWVNVKYAKRLFDQNAATLVHEGPMPAQSAEPKKRPAPRRAAPTATVEG